MYSVPSPPPPAPWNPSPQPSILRRTTSATTPPPASPTSPTRSGRLRGLSYLRTYTHNHLLSRDSHNSSSTSSSTLARATTYPSSAPTPTSPTHPSSTNRSSAVAASPAAPGNSARQPSPTARRSTTEPTTERSSNPENLGSTSGWLPTVGGHSVASRIPTEPQSSATASSTALLAGNPSTGGASEFTNSMARTRSATVDGATDISLGAGRNESPMHTNTNGGTGMSHQLPSIRFTAHQDPRAQRPSLVFSPMARILPTGKEIIKVGRYSERDNQPTQAANVPSAAPVGFKSKVVSRRHCEFWCTGGRWFIKDVKSSSGTFLNHIRLSSPGTESRPFPVNDGDIVQLGIDFKGGEEMIFRCVKIRVELNKGWQNGPSSFNVQSHKRLRELNAVGKPPTSGSSQDCSICLGPIAPCQSLFVAPCSHTWHYKCIRVIINGPHWPHFICPNCRTVADLEAELDDPFADGEWEELGDAEAAAVRGAREATAAPEESPAVSRSARQANIVEPTQTTAGVPRDESDREQSVPSDAELAEASEESEADHGVHGVATSIQHLNVEDLPSPPSSSNSQPQVSNATVPPVDIIARKPISNSSASRLAEPTSNDERVITRTPSPNGLHPSSVDAMTGVEGPMTPRNDAGPFIFDGSAGRASGISLANAASMNLDEAADSPTSTATPQPAAES